MILNIQVIFFKAAGIIHAGLNKVRLQEIYTDEMCEEVLKTNNSFACKEHLLCSL